MVQKRPKKTTHKPLLNEVLETVIFIKKNVEKMEETIATKDDLADLERRMATNLTETESRLHNEIVSKTGGISRRLDEELDKRKVLDVRVTNLERKSVR